MDSKTMEKLDDKLQEVCKRLWLQDYHNYETQVYIKREIFRINLVLSALGNTKQQITVCDIGAGWGILAAGFAALGMRSIMIDDFGDEDISSSWDRRIKLYSELGIEVIQRDVISHGIDFVPNSIDVFTCFDSMEHFHNSPKPLFHQIMEALKPGGLFVLCVPNCARLWKRLFCIFGRTQFSSMQDWYEQPIFRGHVREPNVQDLKYIASDMGLREVDIIGRNDNFFKHKNILVRVITRLTDILVRMKPSFCVTIYMLGKKPINN
jgi:2-polyprenyl-3-methyl-5-hydroxy-6-metoxy-1,4-benzoquinol methylase